MEDKARRTERSEWHTHLVLETAEGAAAERVWTLVWAGDDLVLRGSGGGGGGRRGHSVHVYVFLVEKESMDIHGGRYRKAGRRVGVLVVGGRGVTYWD